MPSRTAPLIFLPRACMHKGVKQPVLTVCQSVCQFVSQSGEKFLNQHIHRVKQLLYVASSLADFNDAILWLHSSSTSAVLIKTKTYVCHGITAHTLCRFHSEHQVHTEKLCTPESLNYQRGVADWGCGQFFLSLLSAYWVLSAYFLAVL